MAGNHQLPGKIYRYQYRTQLLRMYIVTGSRQVTVPRVADLDPDPLRIRYFSGSGFVIGLRIRIPDLDHFFP